MSSTFINLTNTLLRRLNEVEIADADFVGSRGVQALAKDAIRASIAKINQAEFEWPFNAAEHTQILSKGQTEYTWPAYFKQVDWNSFQIQADASLGVSYTHIGYMDRDLWYRDFRDDDYQAGAAGRAVPQFAFPAHGDGFGVTPSPDQAYSIKFRYYLNYSDLQQPTDVTRIPTTYDNVIVDGGMYHMYMFRDNMESAGISAQAFQQGLKEMQTLLINKYESISDTRVAY